VPNTTPKKALRDDAVFIAILLGCVVLVPSNAKLQETLRRTYPVGAVTSLIPTQRNVQRHH
jgi:hypothetical protein